MKTKEEITIMLEELYNKLDELRERKNLTLNKKVYKALDYAYSQCRAKIDILEWVLEGKE